MPTSRAERLKALEHATELRQVYEASKNSVDRRAAAATYLAYEEAISRIDLIIRVLKEATEPRKRGGTARRPTPP